MNMDISQKVEEYKKQGFCMVPGLFSEVEIGQMREAIERYIANNGGNLTGRQINFSGDKVNSIHTLHQSEDGFFQNLLSDQRIREFASKFLEDEAVSRAAELFAKPAKVGLPSPWHQDDAYWCVDNHNGLTIWIALDHCDASNGSVNYIKGSHRFGLLEHGPSYAPGSSQKIADDSLIAGHKKDMATYAMKPGDVLVHHALTVHGSAANTSDRPRRGLTLQFIGKKSKYDKGRMAKYEASLAKQIQERSANGRP